MIPMDTPNPPEQLIQLTPPPNLTLQTSILLRSPVKKSNENYMFLRGVR